MKPDSDGKPEQISFACLGWGSLIWDRRKLQVGDWHDDGPLLPVEFARESKDGRITLVVIEDGPASRVLWANIEARNIDDAVAALAAREGSSATKIGRWPSSNCYLHGTAIAEWAKAKGLSGVVWTALDPGFRNSRGPVPKLTEVIQHLHGLSGNALVQAIDYVAKAPAQIATRYREAIEAELGIERASKP